ncbi:hypothetical protein Tco_0784698 [Tanacetum coccineum]
MIGGIGSSSLASGTGGKSLASLSARTLPEGSLYIGCSFFFSGSSRVADAPCILAVDIMTSAGLRPLFVTYVDVGGFSQAETSEGVGLTQGDGRTDSTAECFVVKPEELEFLLVLRLERWTSSEGEDGKKASRKTTSSELYNRCAVTCGTRNGDVFSGRLEGEFYPTYLTALAGRRWLMWTHGANLPEAAHLQPCLEQLSVPIYHADVNVVAGDTSLSFALLNVHTSVEGAKKHDAALRHVEGLGPDEDLGGC